MGIVQGLTEFLPVSSSGHLIIVPFLFGWDDAFITSLAFSVMLHLGTLVALLVYFRADWLRLIPAGLAPIRDRSFRGDADRRLAWLLVAATIPAAIVGLLFDDFFETQFREVGLVAVTLVVGGVILCRRPGRWPDARRSRTSRSRSPSGIGAAQALALIPGISRSGISISAGRFAGLDREAAARFAFLMATPITAGRGLFEARKLVTGEAGVDVAIAPLLVGMVAALAGRAAGHPLHAALPADAVARHLRLVPVRAGRGRPRRLARRGRRRRRPMEVMKQLRQRAIRDLVAQRPIRTQQELAAALRERGFRTTQATISRDVAELGLIKVTPRGHRRLRAAAAPHRGRDVRRGPAAQAAGRPAARDPRGRPAARPAHAARAPPTPSPPPWTAPAGRRSRARSPATTRCSWPCPTAARCSA